MGKTCNTILGVGLAGAIIGMHIYKMMEPKEQCKIKQEVREAVDELKKAAGKLNEIG